MLLTYVFLGRILGSEGFGRFGLVHGLFVAVGVFSLWGVPQAVVRFVAAGEHGAAAVLGAARKILIRVNLFASVGLFAGGPWIAQGLLGDSGLVSSVWAGIVFVVAQVVIQTAVALEQGRLAFGRAAAMNGANGVAFLTGGVIGGSWGGVLGAVVGISVASLLLALGLIRIRGGVPTALEEVPEAVLMRISRFSRLTVLSAGLVWPVLFLAQAMLQRASGYEEVALFAAARPWFQGIILIPTIVARTSLPLAAQAFTRGDRPGLLRLIGGGGVAGLVSVLPFALLLFLLPDVVAGFYGAGFEGVVDVLRILAATALVIGLHLSFGQIPAVVDRMEVGVLINVVWATAFLSLAWLWVPAGAVGLAWAFLVAYGVNAVLTVATSLYLVRRR